MKTDYLILALASMVTGLVGQELPHQPSEQHAVIESTEIVAEPLSPVATQGTARLVVDQGDVIAAREAPLGERVVRFERIRPLILPPIPEPAAREPESEEMAGIRVAAREAIKNRQFLSVSGTVYIPESGPEDAKTFLKFWTRPGGKEVSMWINANLLWLGGFSSYESEDTIYSLLMICSVTDSAQRERMNTLSKRRWQLPEIPDFPEGEASIVVVEGDPTPADLAPFTAMTELYRKDKLRLKRDYERRIVEGERRRQERLADPPERKSLNIRYWRIDEAGQVGQEPQPAVIR